MACPPTHKGWRDCRPTAAHLAHTACRAQTQPYAASPWPACVQALSQQIDQKLFDLWIKPLTAQMDDEGASVTVFAPNRFKLDFVREKYAGHIAAALEEVCGAPVQVRLAVAAAPAARPKAAAARPAPAQAAPTTQTARQEPQQADTPAPAERPRSQLNPSLTFETMVEGTANRMAHAAALHVASAPSKLYIEGAREGFAAADAGADIAKLLNRCFFFILDF